MLKGSILESPDADFYTVAGFGHGDCRGDSRIFFMGWHRGDQQPVRGAMGKVMCLKWDDIKMARHSAWTSHFSFYKYITLNATGIL